MRGYDDWKTTDPRDSDPEPEFIHLAEATGPEVEAWFIDNHWDDDEGISARVGTIEEPMRFALAVQRMIASDKDYLRPVPILHDEPFVLYAVQCYAFNEPHHSSAAWLEYAKECIRAITGDENPYICERWPVEVEYDGPDNVKDLD